MLKVTGEKNAAVGFILSSFFLTIPVFVDTVIFLMMPLAKAMSMRLGKTICCWLYRLLQEELWQIHLYRHPRDLYFWSVL